uniref:Protein CHROMATIN REMODELING 5-like n=1 Tax=Dermatophagoides pteronyssinus TaxID=6956 RepID=A0A6P6XMF0_DERPT|nr:protein CHROMATIN REMODELING 5-like [Dermatophagoides pteronyssinus]
MISRMKNNLSVLLADEMGLGKTVQTIAVIGHLLYVEKLAGPFLLIVPQSTMDNWYSEFAKWLPLANVVLYHGDPQSREIIKQEELKVVKSRPMSRIAYSNFIHPRSRLSVLTPAQLKAIITNRLRYRADVVIATPSIFQWPNDLQELRSISWYLITVDEAHQLKNSQSKRFKELCSFRARYRLLLSGTPLHNNLDELWSLLHFMNPTLYPSLSLFKPRFSEIENTASTGELKQQQLQELQRCLSPIVLRRVKRDVLKSLPKKIEWILRVELSPIQQKFCQDVILHNYESLSKNTGGSKITLQNICVELKKICNHPFLLSYHKPREQYNHDIVWSSGKMGLLHKLLKRLKEKNHRVLIFSQMVRMINILSKYLTLNGYKHQRLDGTMRRDVRKKAMDRFNAPDSDDFCFLLSTKAGGLGINLTSADTVIIYDSDWNPQNDLQAEARAHRIGQKKTVQIYRLITKNSIEEEILERAKSKMVLDALVVQGLNVSNTLTMNQSKSVGFSREELGKILKFGATKLWSKNKTSENNLDVDLDAILKEAEQSKEDDMSVQLLNSYSNITDFNYEAPAKAQDSDKIKWTEVVPLEERLKYKQAQKKTGKKKRSKLLGFDLYLSDEENENDSTTQTAVVSRKKRRATTKSVSPEVEETPY